MGALPIHAGERFTPPLPLFPSRPTIQAHIFIQSASKSRQAQIPPPPASFVPLA